MGKPYSFMSSVLILITLNFLLFCPFYFTVNGIHEIIPFFNSLFDGISELNFASLRNLFSQLFLQRSSVDPFRISIEMLFIAGFISIGRCFFFRAKKFFLAIATSLYLLVLLFELYRTTIMLVLHRSPLWLEDIQLIKSALQYCNETLRLPNYSFEAMLVIGLLLIASAFYYLFSFVWKNYPPFRMRTLLANVSMVAVLYLFFYKYDLFDEKNSVQLLSRHVLSNYEQCLIYIENNRKFPEQSQHHQKYFVHMNKKPNIFLFVIESYGMLLFEDEQLRIRTESLLRQAERDLMGIPGLKALSHSSTSPVFGGVSWLSTASLISGTLIKTQTRYEQFKEISPKFPHLINYLGYHGYERTSFQPGTTFDGNLYGFDRIFIRGDMGYQGKPIGWGEVPDSATFAKIEKEIKHMKTPFLLHYMSLSTHTPWEAPPALPTGDKDAQGNYFDVNADGLATGKESFRDYFVTISYEWHLLKDFFKRYIGSNFLAVIIGDHQPYIASRIKATYNVPVHILTDVPVLLDAFKQAGFDPGLLPSSKPAIRTQDIYPIMLEAFNYKPKSSYTISKKSGLGGGS